ncbi:DUF3883 domain-containing protein [Actimicrobium sp. CCI2.3]|uniref:DUF3883 domain-containing protein n=1 Tax=Actimicrobium sp. CCI2.3 TaxID=3048616 RepID=UPI002AB35D65|nr:DUF3883 domain-containing protein [Actimicrobium sp. CCI2.3]MDY7574458.1 DUF3883 domain-containing protein [Actimicrobium sp. CCI2.3]MEB0022464.1 DUF3883 domain-containing protein [Actimicrobium sp. CCI2.3]
MASDLPRLQSPIAVQSALNEFSRIGRNTFLARYGFGKSRTFMVRNPENGQLCDSKAIVGAAFGFQYPTEGPLIPAAFSGGEATVVTKLQSLGFVVVEVGHDWSQGEVDATVAAYFDMLIAEAREEKINKSERNASLRSLLQNRTKASVELKHQNISAVLHEMDLPYIQGYKPRGNSQLLLRKTVARFILDHPDVLEQTVDALEEVKTPGASTFHAVVVDAPLVESIPVVPPHAARLRLPRKIDFAGRDASNRSLGRAGEQWVLGFEQHRLAQAGLDDLFQRVDWVSDRLGDGTGYDILSFDAEDAPRYIEVKTTNGAHKSSFIISRNELDFSRESGDAFQLYRVFQFGTQPKLYMLQGDVTRHLHMEPIDFRASFRRMIA